MRRVAQPVILLFCRDRYGTMTEPRTRQSRRRRQGQKVLDQVRSYQLDGNGAVSVTAARKFVKENDLSYPAVIHVRRTKYTIDSFFLSDSCMFGLPYVEFNWKQFGCLKELGKEIGPDLGPDHAEWFGEVELYKYEFSFI